MRFRSLVVAAVCAAPAAALAQPANDRPLSAGVFAGGTLPSGRLSRGVYDPGFHVGALAQLRLPVRWLAVRVDGTYRRLDAGTETLTDERGTPIGELALATSIFAASASVVARLPHLRSAVQPYATAGGALFGLRSRVTRTAGAALPAPGAGPLERTHGAVFGLGLDAPVGPARAFAEARYERVGEVLRLVPLSLGVRLR